MIGNKIILKPMSEHDLKHVVRIQEKAYKPFYHETIDVIKEKLLFFPNGCWVALDDEIVVGYLFSHHWYHYLPVKLNSQLRIISNNFDCIYIHDIAVAIEYQQEGIGTILFSKAKEITEQLKYKHIVVVSVQNSGNFWNHLGFQPFENIPSDAKDKLLSYGQGCSYMIFQLERA